MSRRNSNSYIGRIKLINFHNFCNETINIAEGGHLFMLGDNASGKTTVLDAIHYVLTAGEDMEFNAAARVAGSKQQGRRIQSVITRYNVDTGHMRPSGGVTYAALEISGSGKKTTTIAIGMSVNSPDDQVTRWGIIRDCPLEEVPFLISDPEGERPRDKTEMRKVLGDSGFFGQPQSFCNQVAERFLGGKSKFSDFCRFLKIGKAYREIAAHTSDYHALFKQLLPESDREVFERIIETLKSIDGSRGDLENLVNKLAYINNLISMLNDINTSNRDAIAFDAVEQLIQITHVGHAIAEDQENIRNLTLEQKKLGDSLSLLEEQEVNLNSRYNDLKSEDTGGALIREQELRAKLKLQQDRFHSESLKLESLRVTIGALEADSTALMIKLRELLEALLKKMPDKSIKTGVETGHAMLAIENFLHGVERGENNLEPAFDNLLTSIRTVTSENKSALGFCENTLKGYSMSESELKTEEKLLNECKEAMPEYNGLDLLLEELDRSMLNYIPLFKGLEWHPDLTKDQKGHLEELIGDEILSIITVHEDNYDEAADIILKKYPGHRLALAKPDSESGREFREWAARVFDVRACNPQLLDILLRELSASRPPDFEKREGIRIAKFRSHVRSFAGIESRFIGADSREKEQKRKLKEIVAELKEIGGVIREHEKEQKELKSQLRILNNLETLIVQAGKDIRGNIQARKELQISLKHDKNTLLEMEQKGIILSEEMKKDRLHLEKLQKLIIEKDLEALNRNFKEIEGQLEKCRKQIAADKESVSRCKFKTELAQEKIGKNEIVLENCKTCLDQKLLTLENKHAQLNARTLVEKLRAENRLHLESDAAKKASECRQKAIARQVEIRLRISDITGASYGFSFDIENNQLFARGGVVISAIEESLRKNVEDQHLLINEKTTELFKKLIMDTMLRTLWNNVHGLDKMVGDINKLLKDRFFGNNTYRIKVRPHEQYEGLLKLIKSFTHYNPDVEEKLAHFFQDHKDVLISTAPGTTPEMLDYRNWYHYEMCIHHSAAGDGTVMDSRVKSIGSGGEQAVPNYLLVLTIAHFMYEGFKLNLLLFDEAFYGIDSQRRDQLMGFATDLGLQLFVASPDQDGVKDEIACSTSLLVVKDAKYNVHLYPFDWKRTPDVDLFDAEKGVKEVKFEEELRTD
jgi:DNA repair exonuclease SbcCD ATPase subunit